MNKTILILFSILFLSQTAFAQEQFNLKKFLDQVNAEFVADTKKLNKQFKLGKYDRWDADQKTGKLIFSDKGKPKVIASFQIAGSYSTYSKTWMWSWANQTIDAAVKQEMIKVKEFGEKKLMTQLTIAKLKYSEDYAWTLTSIAGQIIKAKGAYRGQIPDGFVYFLITDIKWADADKR